MGPARRGRCTDKEQNAGITDFPGLQNKMCWAIALTMRIPLPAGDAPFKSRVRPAANRSKVRVFITGGESSRLIRAASYKLCSLCSAIVLQKVNDLVQAKILPLHFAVFAAALVGIPFALNVRGSFWPVDMLSALVFVPLFHVHQAAVGERMRLAAVASGTDAQQTIGERRASVAETMFRSVMRKSKLKMILPAVRTRNSTMGSGV